MARGPDFSFKPIPFQSLYPPGLSQYLVGRVGMIKGGTEVKALKNVWLIPGTGQGES